MIVNIKKKSVYNENKYIEKTLTSFVAVTFFLNIFLGEEKSDFYSLLIILWKKIFLNNLLHHILAFGYPIRNT